MHKVVAVVVGEDSVSSQLVSGETRFSTITEPLFYWTMCPEKAEHPCFNAEVMLRLSQNVCWGDRQREEET